MLYEKVLKCSSQNLFGSNKYNHRAEIQASNGHKPTKVSHDYTLCVNSAQPLGSAVLTEPQEVDSSAFLASLLFSLLSVFTDNFYSGGSGVYSY